MRNLLYSRRQVLHRRVAEVLLSSGVTAAPEPELLAHHFTQAGKSDEKFAGPAKIAVTLYINGVAHKLTVLWMTLVRRRLKALSMAAFDDSDTRQRQLVGRAEHIALSLEPASIEERSNDRK